MSNVMTSAGTTLSIGTYPATYDAAGFAAVSWTAVAEITDLGSFGKTYTEVKHTSLTRRQTQKFKGSYDNGSLQLKIAKVTSDAGQVAMLAALASDSSYAFKVTLQDGKIEYFSGKVFTGVIAVGNVDTITGLDVTVGLDGDVIEV